MERPSEKSIKELQDLINAINLDLKMMNVPEVIEKYRLRVIDEQVDESDGFTDYLVKNIGGRLLFTISETGDDWNEEDKGAYIQHEVVMRIGGSYWIYDLDDASLSYWNI